MAGIFNANIFNNLVFNTGEGKHSGWFRLWLIDLQSKFLQEYEKGKQATPVVEKKIPAHPIKENADGSAIVLPFKKKETPKPIKTVVEELPKQFKLKPMYRMDTTPDYVKEVSQITSTLSDMVHGFQPTVERMKKTKAENDEHEEVLFLLLAA